MLESLNFYINILKSTEDTDKRLYAIKKLKNYRDEKVVSELTPYLSHENPMIRYFAAVSLGEIGLKSASVSLLEALAEPEDWVRLAVVEAIGNIKPDNSTKLLINYLESEKDNKVKATIIKVLGSLNDENVIPFIAEFLNSQDERIKANTIEALENFDNKKIFELLKPFKTDSNNRVRANTAMVLIKHGKEEGYDILEKMFSENDEWMIASGIYVLGEIGNSKALRVLISHVNEKLLNIWSVKRNYIISLAKFINNEVELEKTEELLRKILISDDEIEVQFAIEIIGQFKLKQFLEDITEKLSSASGDLREKIDEAIDELVDY